MIRPLYVFTTCPYCGHENKTPTIWDALGASMDLILCETESGGCDTHYAVRIEFEQKVTIYKLTLPIEAE